MALAKHSRTMGKKIRYPASTRAETDNETRPYVIPIASKPAGLPHPRLIRRLVGGTVSPQPAPDDFIAEAETNRFN
jgi:hypothetical protein